MPTANSGSVGRGNAFDAQLSDEQLITLFKSAGSVLQKREGGNVLPPAPEQPSDEDPSTKRRSFTDKFKSAVSAFKEGMEGTLSDFILLSEAVTFDDIKTIWAKNNKPRNVADIVNLLTRLKLSDSEIMKLFDSINVNVRQIINTKRKSQMSPDTVTKTDDRTNQIARAAKLKTAIARIPIETAKQLYGLLSR